MPKVAIPSLGIEEEHFVVTAGTHELYSLNSHQAQSLKRSVGAKLELEYKACQLELRTEPTTSGDELLKDITTSREFTGSLLGQYNLNLYSQSTHPSACASNLPARQDQRYRTIESRLGVCVKNLLVCGLHVHVGTFDNLDISVRRMVQLWPLTQILIAANASSRFWNGIDTDWESYRRIVLLGLDAQIPPLVESHSEYQKFLAKQRSLNAADSEQDLWLDVRPGRPGLNTVEFRAADLSSDPADNVALAVFLQGMEYIARSNPSLFDIQKVQLDWQFVEKGCRLAAKHGMKAQVYNPYYTRIQPVSEFALEMLNLCSEGIAKCGNENWIPMIKKLFTPTISQIDMPSIGGISRKKTSCSTQPQQQEASLTA